MDRREWENLVVEELKKLLGDDYRVRGLESQQTNPNRDLALGITKEGKWNCFGTGCLFQKVDRAGKRDKTGC